ncbi:MAG: DUF3299 domain-containing protein [Bacteroidota bacterium]
MPYHLDSLPRVSFRAVVLIAFATLGGALAFGTGPAIDRMPMLDAAAFPEHAGFGDAPDDAAPIEDDVWETLAGYTYEVLEDFEYEVTFSEAVQALHETEVTLKGYIIPLEQGITVTHFLLSTFPLADCYYCMPGGPESFVEVKTDDPVAFTYEPITLSGTFAVLEKEEIDQMGMFYRMTDAKYLDQ